MSVKRFETFQIEKIEWIITAIADNGMTHQLLEQDDPEVMTSIRETQKAQSLIPIYENNEVINFCRSRDKNQFSSRDINELIELLTKQVRQLLKHQ